MTELDGEALLRIDRAVGRFEEAWQAGAPRSLEALLGEEPDGDARPELLRYALAVELASRRSRGEVPRRADYEGRFPDQVAVIAEAFASETTLWSPPAGPDPPRGTAVSSPCSDAKPPGPAPGTGGRRPGRSEEADFLTIPIFEPPSTALGRLGKYEVVGPLGGGGQGSAILARDPDVGRLVVVKRYHTTGDDAAREAKALGRVRSPYTARCLDLMRHEGELFLVMEYIPGRTLGKVIERALPSPRAAARMVEQLAEGLEAVHACGLVHRDIKPSNVVIGDDGVARLVDFGLAAHLGSDALQGVSGTPPYMPPEQARGQWERIDARSDVYGLGGVLYALLTGRVPHPGKSLDEVMRHAREGIVTPPRGLGLKKPVPRDLERVVMKALEPDPARRHASAAELRRALVRARIGPALRATAIGVVAASVFGLGTWLLGRPAAAPVTAPVVAADAPVALTGELIVRVSSEGPGGKRNLSVVEPGALPVRVGEMVHLEGRLSRPAYAYLLWIDGQGKVSLLYPRDDGQFGSRPPGGRAARSSVNSPEAVDQGLEMSGPGGLETALLLARGEPLPPGTDLASLIDPMPRAPLRDEKEVALLDYDPGRSAASTRIGQHRGIDPGRVGKIDDPILHLMERLRSREHFDVIKAVRFAYKGEPEPAINEEPRR